MCTALAGEAVPGSSASDRCQQAMEEGRGSASPPFSGTPLCDFMFEQLRNKSLRHTFNQVTVVGGQNLQPNVALSYPYFPLIKDRLY